MKKFKDYLKRQKSDPEFASGYDLVLNNTRLDMIGELIHEARLAAGMSQEDLATIIHTKRSAISRLERHSSDIKLSTLFDISKALGKKLEIILR